jgi:hypothetical protein
MQKTNAGLLKLLNKKWPQYFVDIL